MTAPGRLLADCIHIRGRFLRSVNLEKDYEAASQNGDYIVTSTALDVLRRVTEGLSTESTYRALTVTGPYGVGKSAFAVFLTRLLCDPGPSGTAAWHQLEQADSRLAADLKTKIGRVGGLNKKRLLPVLVTGRRAPAALCLAEGIQAGLARIKGKQAERLSGDAARLIRDIRKGHIPDGRQLTSLLENFASQAARGGYGGLLLLADELGKLFEFAARAPQRGDVFALQEIAELASRSGESPVVFVGFLHQGFEDYGQHLDALTRKEWAKIQGRFEDVRFLEPVEQVVRMIPAAIKWSAGVEPSRQLRKRVGQVAKQCVACGVAPAGIRGAEFEQLCIAAYPLHPTTLVALPFIFRRFAQNERSLFSYLSSMEPGGFQEFLRTNVLSSEPVFVRLDSLFDHFTINFGTALFRQPQARRWMEASDVLERKETLEPLQVQIVKALGVLGALGEFCHLRSGERMISAALADCAEPPSDLRAGLQGLHERSIVTYRAFNDTYRIWEGSDVDIDDRIDEGRRKVRGAVRLAADIAKHLEPRPLVARRHSFETGALRYFHTVYLDDPCHVAEPDPTPEGAAGQVLVCLATGESQALAFQQIAETAKGRRDVVVAIPQQTGELLAAVSELAAMRWAWEETPALRDDRVARRELAMRVAEAEYFLRRNLATLLDPRAEPLGSGCLWFWKAKRQRVRSRVDVSQLLSRVSAAVFSETPLVRNELIVRRSLSSSAAAARRTLIERMLAAPDEPALGISGFPPERSMYESVLKATGLHREFADDKWGFSPPPPENPRRLRPAWDCLRDHVFAGDGEPHPLQTLFKILADQPYGVLDGLYPVLLCAFMDVHRDEVTLYREGRFIPEPTIADFEVLMRRPELFALAGSRLAGARTAVVARIAKGLQAPAATVPAVRALFRMVRPLPELAWRTKEVNERTQRVRQAFEKARAPERFLFADLPQALDLPLFTEDGGRDQDVETFFERLNECLGDWSTIAGKVQGQARATLLRSCGVEATDRGWQQLRELAARLEPRETDPFIRQVLQRIVGSSGDGDNAASVLAFVSGRPPANWLDEDIHRFPQLAEGVGESIRRAAARAGLRETPQEALAGLTAEQRERAKSLADDLARRLNHSGSPQLLRAALLLLADQVSEV